MIELTFRGTPAGGTPQDIIVRIHEPFRSPPGAGAPGAEWPWSIVVEVDGRPFTTYGVDPLEAIEAGAKGTAIVVRGVYDDVDPPIEPRQP
jgi:hypothetical protein